MAQDNSKGKVYNVKNVDFKIISEQLDSSELTVAGISEEGFGVTPTAETETIPGLKGEEGFSVDPSKGAEISLTLKSTSDVIPDLIDLYNKQQDGNLAPFEISVEVNTNETGGTNAQEAFGFSSIVVENAMFVNYAPFETDTRSAPDYEFEFAGYGLSINEPGANTDRT